MTTATPEPEQLALEAPAALPEPSTDVLTSLFAMKVNEVAESGALFESMSGEPILFLCIECFDKEKKAPYRKFSVTYYGVQLKTVTLTLSRGVFTWN